MCRDEVRVVLRAIGKLLATPVIGEEGIIDGGGQGDTVPTREGFRRFKDLLSHKKDFLKNQEKMEGIKAMNHP